MYDMECSNIVMSSHPLQDRWLSLASSLQQRQLTVYQHGHHQVHASFCLMLKLKLKLKLIE